METTGSRVESGRGQLTIRSAAWSPWAVLARAVSSAARLVPDRWLIDLSVFAVAAFILGATALCGLAVVSTWTPSAHQPAGSPLLCDARQAGPVTFDACDDSMCCEEMR
jgi:hypothetical protein